MSTWACAHLPLKFIASSFVSSIITGKLRFVNHYHHPSKGIITNENLNMFKIKHNVSNCALDMTHFLFSQAKPMWMVGVVLVPLKSGGSTNFIFPPKLRVLQWICHLFYLEIKKTKLKRYIHIDESKLYISLINNQKITWLWS